jgi:hypothetical protein
VKVRVESNIPYHPILLPSGDKEFLFIYGKSSEAIMDNIETIIEQIKADMTSGKSVEQIFHSLLPLLEKDLQTTGKLAEFMVAIPDERVGKLLQRMLGVVPEKKIRKIIKRSIYRLKSKGVAIDEMISNKEKPVLRPSKAEPKEGFGSGIDFLGQRLLFLVIPHPGRVLTVMHGIVSDLRGLIDFSQEGMARREVRVFFEEVRGKNPIPIVEMEPSYVAFLFAQAYQLNPEKKGISYQEYLQAKSEIDGIKKDYGKPLIYSHLQADEIIRDDRMLVRGEDLLKTDVFNSWKIEEDQIQPFTNEILGAEESKIVLNQTQKEVRLQGIYQKALTELFSGERKFLYQRRLEEMAYVLFKLGKEEDAKTALSVAMDLEKPLNSIQPNPFLYQLVVKSIYGLLAENNEKKSKEPSLIIKP